MSNNKNVIFILHLIKTSKKYAQKHDDNNNDNFMPFVLNLDRDISLK